MNNYYSEELNPKSIYRQDYVDSLNKFVDDELASRKAQRKLLITPSAYKDNQEFYRAEFIKMLGFPLSCQCSWGELSFSVSSFLFPPPSAVS